MKVPPIVTNEGNSARTNALVDKTWVRLPVIVVKTGKDNFAIIVKAENEKLPLIVVKLFAVTFLNKAIVLTSNPVNVVDVNVSSRTNDRVFGL